MIQVHCDIEGCGNAASMTIDFSGPQLPAGWVTASWTQVAKAEVTGEAAAALDFIEQMRSALPPELQSMVDAYTRMAAGAPGRTLACKAFMCPACMDKRMPVANFHVLNEAGTAAVPGFVAPPAPPIPYPDPGFSIPGTIPPDETDQ